MMQAVIPIFMGLLNMVASRVEPVDFSDVDIAATDTRDQRNAMLFSSGNFNADPNDFTGSKPLARRHQQINPDDERNQLPDWIEQESKSNPDALLSKKIFNLHDIDGASFNDRVEVIRSMDEMEDVDLNRFSTFLIHLLSQPTWDAPLVVVGDNTLSVESGEPELKSSGEVEHRSNMWKRSRYYRRYPWKRQNARSRHGWDYEAAHFCKPSRDDVFQLLVALHDVRQGNKRRVVNFCKRPRSAGTVFTNIRFLGRRK